jgi:hypothetical protein
MPDLSGRNTRNKEDHAVDHAVDAAVQQPTAAFDFFNPWKLLRSDLPMGSLSFQGLFRHYAATRKDNPLSEAMERTIQQANKQGVRVPPPFFEAKRKVERREKAELAGPVGGEIPELEAEPWAK